MTVRLGSASIQFEHGPSVIAAASAVGPKEGEGPLGPLFDFIDRDGTMEQKSWEEAESELQKKALQLAVEKAAVPRNRIRYLFAGDLLGQCVASSFGLKETAIPLFGLYGACSTMGESLSLAAMTLAAGYAEYALCVTSSHYASAERQFRFPSDYGNQRPASATWTVTGSGAVVLGAGDDSGTERIGAIQQNGGGADGSGSTGNAGSAGESGSTSSSIRKAEDSKDGRADNGGSRTVRITGITTGRIVDYGVKDSMNMGAAMAPAAVDTICQHFEDFGTEPKQYDKIITGDLGTVGQKILLDLAMERGFDLRGRHTDCGIEIYQAERQDTHAGGSGCGCSAAVFASYILPLLARGEWKRVLFVPTGALLSKISFNEGKTIPGIAHAVLLESEEGGL